MPTDSNRNALVTLIIHRDDRTQGRLRRHLEGEGYVALTVTEPREALRMFFDVRPDATIVEADESGIELIRVLRAAADTAIVALVDDSPSRVVLALNAGADDVIEDACAPMEFNARLRAALRRRTRGQGEDAVREVQTGGLTIDRATQRVLRDGLAVRLSATEYRLLEALASRAGDLVPHSTLLSEVWGPEYVNDVQYLRVYVGYLRKKLEDDPSRPLYLQSEWGSGYRLAKLPITVHEAQATTEAVSEGVAADLAANAA